MTGERFAILLRHGDYHQKPETPSALQPFGLSDTGMVQAMNAGRELAAMARANGWKLSSTIMSSQLLRAWETATFLCRTLGEETGKVFKVDEEADLAERSVGAFANLTLAQIQEVLANDPRYSAPPVNWKSDSTYKLPALGAESLMEAGERVARALTAGIGDLKAVHETNAKVFVGHGASLRHAAYHLKVLNYDDIRGLSMHHARPVVLKCSDDGRWSHCAGGWKERTPKDVSID
ncbi:histidine phosphatase family protein [uncultured Roseibium sp.]|uniref:histidine phosphatase family protein n=1 Tax=uncultured Roseibium sp. TaxID=1936171 RepID=UPI0026026A52|nr:histidine phosphatase family protein [uncultured Roseibium sp.]